MNANDYIDSITNAQNLIAEAIDMLQFVARETRDAWAENYIIAPLRIVNSADSGYVSRDANLDDWLAKFNAKREPICPFCDGSIAPDLSRPGISICLDCGESTAFSPA